jgi:glycosyltransferase involved in cell wall biosynthesis
VEKEARTLSDAGYEVTVVCKPAAGLPSIEERDGIRIVRPPRSGLLIPGWRFLRYGRTFERALVEARPQILHAHDSDTLGPVAAAARRLDVPFVYDAHELWLGLGREGRSWPYFALMYVFFSVLERRLIRRSAAQVTVSPPIARWLERRYHLKHVELLPNYPEADPGSRRDLRTRITPPGLPRKAQIILYLGGLIEERGLEALVQSIPLLRSRAHLVLLGKGALEGPLRRLAAELEVDRRVHVLAPVPSDEVVGWAASADIGVSPLVPSSLNNRYSLGNKLFQYMAAGLPVLASDFPQVRDVVVGNDAGLCIDTTDPHQIASAIDALLADEDRRGRMGRNARRAVEERYNWDVAAQTLLGVYRSLGLETVGT